MMILIIALATLATFVNWMLISKASLRYLLGILSMAILGLSVYFLTDHFLNHTGMKVETTTTTQQIYSAGDPSQAYGMIIYKNLGTKTDNKVIIYRNQKDDKKATSHFVPDKKDAIEAVKKSADFELADVKQAQVKTTTKRYVWKSQTAKRLYGFGGENKELVSQKSVVQLPKKTWLALTPDQAKKLSSVAGQMKEQMESQMAANPQQARQIQELAQSDPQAYAQMQVKMIKEILKIKS
ncbi:DUF4811 domain-containing protein [Streptococcus sobrinus]|uniref:DUF4811 domain-containing protein n=1 Tax=Streptococcus sobrinus TaxID=1310 RepID=UPI0002E359FD|nr:DUF4811 domain-containing protein [Streptococcus sobrinus]